MKTKPYLIGMVVFLVVGVEAIAQIPAGYKGKPFNPNNCAPDVQIIPGRVELVYFDEGSEGIAYHDTDSLNNGFELNNKTRHQLPGLPNEILNFRKEEGVDISFTKSWVDFSDENLVMPRANQQYIGWMADGEWTNYTVDVKRAGKYKIISLYSNVDNKSSLLLNGKLATKLVLPKETGYLALLECCPSG